MEGKNEKNFKFVLESEPLQIAKHISIDRREKVYDSDSVEVKTQTSDIEFDLTKPPMIK